MKVIEVTSAYIDKWDPAAGARKCPCCHRAVKPGQWVVHHRFNAVAFAQTDVHQHVSCLRALTANVPEDIDIPVDPRAASAKLTRELTALAAAQQEAAA